MNAARTIGVDTALPSVFISHGGPNIVTDPSEARDYLAGLSALTGRPKAIVLMSAHFETDGPVVVTDPAPGMIYDFGGFAPELYKIVYPAPGAPEMAMRVAGLLQVAGLHPRIAPKRGYDHGAWTPMLLAFPKGDIPIVQVSVDPRRDAAYHYAIGAALSSLRREGILLVGSGHITHNLRAFVRSDARRREAGRRNGEAGWRVRRLVRRKICSWRSRGDPRLEEAGTLSG